jgi:hypothetical protein
MHYRDISIYHSTICGLVLHLPGDVGHSSQKNSVLGPSLRQCPFQSVSSRVHQCHPILWLVFVPKLQLTMQKVGRQNYICFPQLRMHHAFPVDVLEVYGARNSVCQALGFDVVSPQSTKWPWEGMRSSWDIWADFIADSQPKTEPGISLFPKANRSQSPEVGAETTD